MIKELWATPDGHTYLQRDTWGGFWKVEPIVDGSDRVYVLPTDAVLVMVNGRWVDGVLEAAQAAAGELSQWRLWLAAETRWERAVLEGARSAYERAAPSRFYESPEWEHAQRVIHGE